MKKEQIDKADLKMLKKEIIKIKKQKTIIKEKMMPYDNEDPEKRHFPQFLVDEMLFLTEKQYYVKCKIRELETGIHTAIWLAQEL